MKSKYEPNQGDEDISQEQVTLDKESDMLVFEEEGSPEEEKHGEDKEVIQNEDEVAGSEKEIKDDKQEDEDGSSENQDVKDKSSNSDEHEIQLLEEESINIVVEHKSQDEQCPKDEIL